MKLIFLGPPGAGKGTIADRVKERLGIPHISTGDLFRAAIKNGTDLGKQVKAIVDRGDLVPDELTTAIVRERIDRDDAAGGFILDGFPRTIGQAEALATFSKMDAVINFIVDEELIVKRLSGRRLCKGCGKSYHVEYMKPKKEGVCDDCSGTLYTRDDDQIEAIRNRLTVYAKSTQPLIDYYEGKGLLKNLDGSLSPEAVAEAMISLTGK
jgi:adenylate kinase